MKAKALISLILISVLTACGFQLRGTAPLPEILQRLAIEPHSPYLPLQRQIRELLQVNGVTVVTAAQQPTALVTIQSEDFQVQDTSIGADGRIREQAYTYIVTFIVSDAKGRTLMGPETIRSERIVEYDPNQALSQSLEEKVIRNETRLDVSSQLVRRLSYVRNTAEAP